MENKKLLIILALIVVIGGGLIYYYQNGFSFLSQENNTPVEENTPEENNGEEPAEELEEIELTVFAKDEFEMQIPSDWIQIEAPQGIHTLLLNNSEKILDAELEKAGFKSYMAVTKDTLSGKTVEEFKEYVKGVLKDSLPAIEFTKEEDMIIQGRDAKALEAKVTQEGYVFKVLLVLIPGENEETWTLSFNTAEVRWENNKDLFYQMAESFKIK